jgi:SOS response regulatory protein OraA/RecX
MCKIKSKSQKKINKFAIDSLINGVKSYDWNNDHRVLTPYIKKYIRSSLINNL